MALVNQIVNQVINGVSQQPDDFRFQSQGTLQENGLSTVIEGQAKRPPTTHITELPAFFNTSTQATNNAFFSVFKASDGTDRLLSIQTYAGGDVSRFTVHGEDGTEYPIKDASGVTITDPANYTYLSVIDPKSAIRANTVGDLTFLINTSKTVSKTSDVSAEFNKWAILFVKQAQASKTYTVTLDGSTTYNYVAGSGESQKVIASNLTNLINSGPYFATHFEGTIFVRRDDFNDFTVSVDIGVPDSFLVFKDKIQSVTDLPALAPRVTGVSFQVAGVSDDPINGYYVTNEFLSDSGNEVRWVETAGPGIHNTIDPSTTPHVLKDFGDHFRFEQWPLEPREVGDEDSAPDPSFVGGTISDLTVYRNRMVMVSGENIVASKAARFADFYRGSAIDVLDDDPIDQPASNAEVALLHSIIEKDEKLFAFSQDRVFTFGPDRGQSLTPSASRITTIGKYSTTKSVRPIIVDDSIYIPQRNNDFIKVKSLVVGAFEGSYVQDDISSQIEKYIPGNIRSFSGSNNQSAIVVSTTADTGIGELYIYKFFVSGDQQLQTSWSKFVFPQSDKVLSAELRDYRIYLVIKRGNRVFFETIDISPGQSEAGVDWLVTLDRKITESDCTVSDNGDGTVTVTMPYDLDTDSIVEFVTLQGRAFSSEITGLKTVKVQGLEVADSFFAGLQYQHKYRPTRPALRVGDTSSSVKIGNTTVKRAVFEVIEANSFDVEVTDGVRTWTNRFTAGKLATELDTDGSIYLENSEFNCAINLRDTNVTVTYVNKSPVQSKLVKLTWILQHWNRGRLS